MLRPWDFFWCGRFALSGRNLSFDGITRGGALRFHRVALPRAAFVLARWAISQSPWHHTDCQAIGPVVCVCPYDLSVGAWHRGHSRRWWGGSSGVDSDNILRIATNLLDIPAEIISLIYCERWAIEIFFRFFKHVLGCRHLLSHSVKGIEMQTYCGIIAWLMIGLWAGRKPTLRTDEVICFYFCGMASEAELTAHPEQT